MIFNWELCLAGKSQHTHRRKPGAPQRKASRMEGDFRRESMGPAATSATAIRPCSWLARRSVLYVTENNGTAPFHMVHRVSLPTP